MQHTYIIPQVNLPKLEEEVAKLNKRAKRLKAQPIGFAATGTAFQDLEYVDLGFERGTKPRWFRNRNVTYNENNEMIVGEERPLSSIRGKDVRLTGRVRNWIYVTVNGESPKFAGWTLTGCLEPLTLDDGGQENIVSTVPGHTVPAEYRNRVGQCDHCHTHRRRTETFVVQHEDGHTKMVGRQCLKDFLGHADPHALAKLAELLFDLSTLCDQAENEDWLGGGCHIPSSWSLLHFLKVTGAVMRQDGWLSRGKARELQEAGEPATATADHVLYYLCPPPAGTKSHEYWEEYRKVIDELLQDAKYEVEAQQAIDWCKEIEAEEGQDYLYNINLVSRAGYVSNKTAGLAASMIMAYRRARGLLEDKKPQPESQHVGVIGQRDTFEVTCHRIFETEGMYGATGIHKMSDNQGNDLTWFASGSTEWLTVGEQYTIKATVKAHDEYKGRKQTVLSRVKIVEEKTKATN